MDLGLLIERHGWHVIAELVTLGIVSIFTAVYLTALALGRVRAVVCPRCARVVSRARSRCPRCETSLETAAET